jgi:hypothetical protein
MTPRLLLILATPFVLSAPGSPLYAQQQPLGSVAEQDAVVSGTASPPNVASGRVLLVGNGTVTAKDHTAEVKLARGGAVEVCSTSGVHLTAGTANGTATTSPLMLSLDRGAMEIRMEAGTSDIVMTPDLRMTVKKDGQLDLRVRVTPNGDTCVENRGPGTAAPAVVKTAAMGSDPAPDPSPSGLTVDVASLFGEDSYDVRPGQHVMFEHGDLQQVVDNESSPCGCPAAPPPEEVAGGAEFGLGGDAAKKHPFPAAISEGLAPPPPVPQAPAGTVHAQVSTTLSFSGDGTAAPPAGANEPPMPFDQIRQAPAPPPAKVGFLHRVGRFFKRLF